MTSQRLLVAALLAAGCSDALTPPPPRAPRAPIAASGFATTASSSAVALWGFNGTVPQSGTELSKEFNPENPPLGSTVVATFVWVGSNNIIDSVTDQLWTGRRVGNTYHLAEYVTAGGISMATYVATNVQNYPYPKQVSGEELLITAYLSSPVSGGGTLVSAYSGVDPDFAVGLGAHRSGSGSGSTQPTYADPGPIAAGAGALVYAITMTSAGSVGRDAPAGFTNMTGEQSVSPSFQFDAEYQVQSAADTVEPRWGWSFNSPSTWLATAVALNPLGGGGGGNQPPTAAFTPDCSGLSCAFTDGSSDPDGTIASSSWTFGDGGSSTAQNPSHTYGTSGTYTVTLTVTDNQGATNSVSHAVTVSAANQPPVAAFSSSCGGLTCTFASTSSDPDGTISTYSWTFGDGGSSSAQNPSHVYSAAGTFTVTLTVTDNQGAPNAASRSISVTQGGVITLDQLNGTVLQFPGGSTQIIKGFNPTNPHLGDAIVATFVWLGSTNIIGSVTDHLTDPNFTPVGNTYHLVDYRTIGGVSMATYVATNVQGFPDPNPDPATVLAVRANFTQPITEGAILLSTYRGVDPNFATAVAALQSNAGTGSGQTLVDPGSITASAGALAYGVSTSNGVFGSDKPAAPFVELDVLSDATLIADAAFAVPGAAGPVHPRWTYFYDGGQYSWLALVLALNPAP